MINKIHSWISAFNEADRETKWFVLNWALYGFIIIVTAIYCYARLDFVRSYEALPPASETPYKTK